MGVDNKHQNATYFGYTYHWLHDEFIGVRRACRTAAPVGRVDGRYIKATVTVLTATYRYHGTEYLLPVALKLKTKKKKKKKKKKKMYC